MVNYPAQIDNIITLPPTIDNLTPVQGSVANRLRDAILAVQTELGIKPSGIYTTVRNRLDSLENLLNTISSEGLIFLPGGDLSGSATSQNVIKLQNKDVSASSPATGNTLNWSGTAWTPSALDIAGGANYIAGILPISNLPSLAGDVTGTISVNTVVKLRGNAVKSGVPSDGYVLTWVTANNDWEPKALPTTAAAVIIVNGFRLTLTSATPITTVDVTGASTLYLTPFSVGQITLYTSSVWTTITSNEVNLVLSGLTNGKNYDVFAYSNAGTLTLELSAAWSTDTTRTDALTRQDGVFVKSTDHSRRYVGTIRATGATTTEDSQSKRFVWNYVNGGTRKLKVIEATDSWVSRTAAYQAANANASNCFEYVCGDTTLLKATAIGAASDNGTSVNTGQGIGIDSTTVSSADFSGQMTSSNFSFAGGASRIVIQQRAEFRGYPNTGYHKITWLEFGGTNATFYGDNGNSTVFQFGMMGEILG